MQALCSPTGIEDEEVELSCSGDFYSNDGTRVSLVLQVEWHLAACYAHGGSLGSHEGLEGILGLVALVLGLLHLNVKVVEHPSRECVVGAIGTSCLACTSYAGALALGLREVYDRRSVHVKEKIGISRRWSRNV